MNKILCGIFLCLVMNANAQHNVILIIADDLGTDYFSFYEDHADTASMPNIRRLLDKGIRFTNAMSNPLCSPTRAGIFTGRYSFRTGVGDAVGGSGSATLDTTEKSIPRLLKDFNPLIQTAHIGKWHLHQQTPASNLLIPNLMGYDYYAGNFLGALPDYMNWIKVTNGVTATCTNYATTETANDAIDWVRMQNTDPFFLWLAFNAPHSPYHLPPAGLHSYTSLSGTPMDINLQPKEYFKASLEALDHEIGRLFDSLIVFNKMDSTDIIFIGDNGNSVRTAQIQDTLRAKGTIYQYGVHVPFIISGPSVALPSSVSSALINTHDLFTTILELFGDTGWISQIPVSTTIDSKSILPIVKNQGSAIRPWAFTEVFKVITDSSDGKAMRNINYKLLNFDDGRQEFYNLSYDSLEMSDLLTGTLTSADIANYTYLCNEMTNLTGMGNFCNSNVGINDQENTDPSMVLFPNPFTLQATLTFEQEQKNTVVKIIDLLGKEISTINFTGKQLIIDKGQMQVGFYFLQVTGAGKKQDQQENNHTIKGLRELKFNTFIDIKFLMNLIKVTSQFIFILIVLLLCMTYAKAQEKKVAPTTRELYNEIAHMDSVMFDAFNTQNMNKFKSLFTEDLEWYQDNGGLLSYKTVFENFDANFKKEFKLTRKLVKGSLEVHPIKDYGAIEIGTHQFNHIENGKEETGTFKFLMIWRKTGNQWQISRVISYDH